LLRRTMALANDSLTDTALRVRLGWSPRHRLRFRVGPWARRLIRRGDGMRWLRRP
jgi:hypothetical protein